MTKTQRRASAKRAGAKRRKVNAAVVAWRRMNPGKKLPAAVRVKRLAGGGFSVTPVKVNAGPFSIRKHKKRLVRKERAGALSRRDATTLGILRGLKGRRLQSNPGMKTYRLVWSPTGQEIAVVQAKTKRAAVRKAPKPYSKYKGEIYAVEI